MSVDGVFYSSAPSTFAQLTGWPTDEVAGGGPPPPPPPPPAPPPPPPPRGGGGGREKT